MTKPKPPARGRHTSTILCPGLRRERKAQNLGLAEAADLLGVPRSRYGQWESRGRAPRAQLQALANHWGLTVEDFARAETQSDLARAIRLELEQAKAAIARAERLLEGTD